MESLPVLLLACTPHRNSCARSPRIKLLCDGRRDALLDWAYHFNQTLPGTAVASLSLQPISIYGFKSTIASHTLNTG